MARGWQLGVMAGDAGARQMSELGLEWLAAVAEGRQAEGGRQRRMRSSQAQKHSRKRHYTRTRASLKRSPQ